MEAAAPRADLSMPQGGMFNYFTLNPTRSVSVATPLSGHDQVSSIQEGLLHDHQGFGSQLEQQSHMQQPRSQDQNQQVDSLLLKLMLSERNQAATTLAPQQHQAWPQDQRQTAIPAANTVNTIRNAWRYPNAHIATSPAPVAEPPSFQGNIGITPNIASLLGLQQRGNNVSAPPASANENINDTLTWLYLLQTNQIRGQQQATPGTVLNSVQQSISQSQLQQAMRPNMFQLYPHNQTILSQTTYSSSSQQPYSGVDALANITSQSQPVQYNQQSQPYQLEQYSLPQQHLMTQPSLQQHQQLQQHVGQDQHPDQPQDEEENKEGQRMRD
jgi:hypothetical protein